MTVVLGTLAHAALVLLPALVTGHVPPAGWVAGALWVACWAVEAPAAASGRPDGAVPPAERVRAALLLATVWVAVGTAGPLGPLAALGAAVAVAGVALRRAAIHHLGDRFRAAVVLRGSRVRTGPYAVLAHPSEWGLVLVALGVALVATSPAALGAWALGTAAPAWWRTRMEDAAMRAVG